MQNTFENTAIRLIPSTPIYNTPAYAKNLRT